MKRIVTVIALAFSVLLLGSYQNKASAQVGVGVSISYQTFYDELSPHGRWIDYPDYGYVWSPNLGPDFQPYSTGGQWVWSDEYDWMWVSDYSWGWAPFHYGRWFYDDFYGWMWVPGYDWSPAWVSWRTGGDYYGWAPLRPGISINIGFGNYNPPYNYWCFAPRRYINYRNIGSYCVDRSRNVTIINNTTIINNYGNRNNVFVNGGPRRRDAERYTGRIRSVNFRDADRPGGREFRNNNVNVYRPQIQQDNDRRFAPRSFDRYNRDNNNRNIANNRNDNFHDRRNRIDNRGFDDRQNNNINSGISNRRRDMIERNNERRNNREFNQRDNSQQQDNNDPRINRRNFFERDRNTERPNRVEQNNDRWRQRRDDISRRQNDISGNEQRRNMEIQRNERRNERREIFQRNNNNPSGQYERREIRSQNQPQQNNRQIERPSRQFRQFENRGNDNRREQRNDNNNNRGGGRRFERRDG